VKGAARVKYATLQQKFPPDSPGYPYADARPEILTPLGDFYHGWRNHTYVPADVCLFR
jgi:hypothetical protein